MINYPEPFWQTNLNRLQKVHSSYITFYKASTTYSDPFVCSTLLYRSGSSTGAYFLSFGQCPTSSQKERLDFVETKDNLFDWCSVQTHRINCLQLNPCPRHQHCAKPNAIFVHVYCIIAVYNILHKPSLYSQYLRLILKMCRMILFK